MQVTSLRAIDIISKIIKARLVPIMCGSPGIGKSQIIQAVADRYNLFLIDLRLGQCDVTDLCGFPHINGNKAGYVPMDTFPLEGDKIPEGYSGWLLLFDELTSAAPALQAAAYKIILDRKVGKYNLHKNVAVCAAGNLETDNAVVHPMSTALQSRLIHLELVASVQEWTDWAADNGLDHRISDFIKFAPGHLYSFQPDHTDNTYACPRTWEFANRILKDNDIDSPDLLPMLAGTISEGIAREFIGFCGIYKDLPTIAEILSSPTTVMVPEENSVMFALTGSISHNADKNNCAGLFKYIERLPDEFQVVCVRETLRRKPELKKTAPVVQWLINSAQQLM